MKKRPDPIPAALLVLLLALCALLAATGCSDDDDNPADPIGQPPDASFTASTSAPAPNLVRLRSVSTSGDIATVEVAITGPTTSTDVYAFAFDLVLSNSAVAAYVAGTAQAGPALAPGGGQFVTALVQQTGNRVIVGVSLGPAGTGHQVGAGELAIVRLTFRVLALGTTQITFAGSTSPTNPTAVPAAINSSQAVIGSITFDTAPATLSGV